MKRTTLIICLLAMAMMACRPDPQPEPDPNIGGQPEDTTGTVVKKYLVKELLNDDPEKIRLAIDWNDDCTQILHVKYGLGYGSIVDYDFKYYGQDSIRVIPSIQPFSYPIWSLSYDSVIIHLLDNKIDSINCYALGEIQHIEQYHYDGNGKLVERIYEFGTKDTFQWEGDNVVAAHIFYYDYEFGPFTNYLSPYWSLPFYLSNFVFLEAPGPLFTPLWKYQPFEPNCKEYEFDEDGYITKMKFDHFYADSSQRQITYYYIIPM